MADYKLRLKPDRVDLRTILQDFVTLFSPIVSSKSFSMTIHPYPEPIFADLDHDRILQVLSNLIGNSLKFTPNGGTIELSVRKQETQVEISVTDNGPGVSKQTQARIFEKFSQMKMNDMRGLGLGLGRHRREKHRQARDQAGSGDSADHRFDCCGVHSPLQEAPRRLGCTTRSPSASSSRRSEYLRGRVKRVFT